MLILFYLSEPSWPPQGYVTNAHVSLLCLNTLSSIESENESCSITMFPFTLALFFSYLRLVLESRARLCSARCAASCYQKVPRSKARAAGTAAAQHKGSMDSRRSHWGAGRGRTGPCCSRLACYCSRCPWAFRYSWVGLEGSGTDWRCVGSRCCMKGSPGRTVTRPSDWRRRGWAAQSRWPADTRGWVSWGPPWSWGHTRGSWGWSAYNHQRRNHIQSGSGRRRWPVFGTCRPGPPTSSSCALRWWGRVCRPGLNP